MATVQAPIATRLRAPGWRDPRLIVGVVLVLLSIAGGVRLISGLDRTDPVYAADRALVPGQEVTSQDLRVVDVRLGSTGPEYVAATAGIEPGTYVLKPVAAGELLPAAAVGDRTQAVDRTVTVSIDAATAASLSEGAMVDLWVSRRDPDGSGTQAQLEPEVLVEQAVVAQIPAQRGALGGTSARASVQIVVPADEVPRVIAAVDQEGLLTLVSRPGGSTDESDR